MGHDSALRYPHLLRPIRLGGLDLPHRMCMGSMHTGLEGPGADVPRLIAFYTERALGGAALILTGGVAITPEGAGEGGNYFVLGRGADEEALRRVASAIRAHGGRVAMQLFHAGRYARRADTGLDPVAPSAVPTRLNPDPPRALEPEEILALAEAWAQGARRAVELGFDAVELMGSEGYLLNEFLAPLTNRRTDAWGGDLAGRMRFPLLAVERVRQVLPAGMPLLYRLSGADLVEGGTSWEDTLAFARALRAQGVDALDVGIGWHESPVPTVGMLVPRAAFAGVARGIRQATGGPVLAANRINTPEVAEGVLSSGAADLVSMARPFLADPHVARKVLEGTPQRINVCIACNQACLDHVLDRPATPASCLVNPAAGRELEFALVPASPRKEVAVVGAGPAGLEAARVLGARGHRVTLFERGTEPGGQLLWAIRVPGKDEFQETLRYYRVALQEVGVRLEMGLAPTADQLATFDAVVLATGVRPRIPSAAEFPGVDLPHVVPYPDVFAGRVPVGERVAIIGAGGVGCDLAHMLSEQGAVSPEALAFLSERGLGQGPWGQGSRNSSREITLLRRGDRIGPLLGRSTRWAVLATLRGRGVRMRTGVRYVGITREGVLLAGEAGPELVPADTVILASGQQSENGLASELEGRVPLHVVGGARLAQEVDAERAILEGSQVGRQI